MFSHIAMVLFYRMHYNQGRCWRGYSECRLPPLTEVEPQKIVGWDFPQWLAGGRGQRVQTSPLAGGRGQWVQTSRLPYWQEAKGSGFRVPHLQGAEPDGSGCKQPPPTGDGGKRYYPTEFWVNSNTKQVLKSESESTGFNILPDLVVIESNHCYEI